MSILSNIFRCVRHIKTEEGYRKVSEWQLAKDVECADGKDVDTKITTLENNLNETVKKLGTQVTMSVSGTTLTITTK